MNPYYEPSRRIPLAGIILFLVGGLLAAAVLALAYAYATWYMPFVYANVLLCLFFGLALGRALLELVQVGRLRSPAGVGGLALLVGAGAVYMQWGVYLMLLANVETVGEDTTTHFDANVLTGLLTTPLRLAGYLAGLNATGSWTVRGTTPSGIWLALIWLAEAVIIVGVAYFLARDRATYPYSEVADEWAVAETLPRSAAFVADAAALRPALESGHLQGLTPYLPQAGADQYARLRLHKAPNDDNCQFLTLENVTRTLDKKGNPTEATTAVFTHLALSPGAYAELKRRFGAGGAV